MLTIYIVVTALLMALLYCMAEQPRISRVIFVSLLWPAIVVVMAIDIAVVIIRFAMNCNTKE